MFYHSIIKFVFISASLSDSAGKRSAIFHTRAWLQLRMSKTLFASSRTHLDSITHEQTIICRQFFTGHVVGSPPMKRKTKAASNM